MAKGGKKKKQKLAVFEETKPPPPPDDDDDDDDEDDSEDEGLQLEDHDEKEASLKVDFGFFDSREGDFHGLRALLVSGGANSLLPSQYDVSSLASTLSEQAAVGSVVKVIGENSEEPAEVDDVLGILSAVSLHAHKQQPFVKEFRTSVTQRCAGDAEAKAKLQAALSEPTTGVVVSSRMVNLPAALVPSLVDSLMQDIEWAVKHAETKEERDSFKFNKLLLLATVEVPAGGGGGSGGGSSSADVGGSDGAGSSEAGEGGKKKKRKKAAAQDAAMALAAQLESLTFARVEEEILAANAEFSVLLNGSGRTRQLLLCLTPAAIRDAVPAMHAAMGEESGA
jgi:hypothetical protein